MNLRKALLPVAVLAILAGTGCAPSTPPVEGKIVDKYVEDWVEFTIVLEANNGTRYHFEVTEDQWNDVKVNDTFSTKDLDQEADD